MSEVKVIGIGNDHAAVDLKNEIKAYLEEKGYKVVNYGTDSSESCDYPVYGAKVGNAVASGEVDAGVLICGTGIGISIAANKVNGVRAAVVSEPVSARLTKEHNNANIIAFGARIVGSEMAKAIVDAWLDAEYIGSGRHERRVNMIEEEAKEEFVDSISELSKENNVTKRVIVYDGMTMSELTEKLNRSLKSTIAGKGDIFASYSLERGVDPYLAVSIMLLETGCNWSCSSLMRRCNNVGGQKGSPSCDGGSYKSYPSLDEGIKGFIDNIADNYYAYGLTTPEAMNKKYAASNMWAIKVNNYISSVKAK